MLRSTRGVRGSMRTAAIIPARGGSKRLPRKNLALLGGMSLTTHAIRAASVCDDIWVSTDDGEIAAHAAREGARVIMRPPYLATDTSSTEDAITHWLRAREADEKPDAIVLLQPSTPMLHGAESHVMAACLLLRDGRHDSVVAVEQDAHRAFDGRVYPRDGELPEWRPFRPVMSRPRTQDVRPQGTECGAFWVFTREHYERTGCRQGGDCRAYVVPRWTSVDIDTAEDLAAAEALLSMRAVYRRAEGA